MTSIVGRGLDESAQACIAAQAKECGRSVEIEDRENVTRSATRSSIGVAPLHAGRSIGGIEELPVPERSDRARSVDF